LLQVDSTWTNEFFQFPLSFAPTINFNGYEEAVFPKSWSDSTSLEFWSYVFAWEIARKEIVTVLNSYFNGLMNYDSTDCEMLKKFKIHKKHFQLGSISTRDAFFSKKTFKLNVSIEQYFMTEKIF
jgi:hypothetical protein